VTIDEPKTEVKRQKKFLAARDARGRIYISEEGINGQMSASKEAAEEYIEWMHADPRFKDVSFKIHTFPEHAFDRMTVKYREQIVVLDVKVDLSNGGAHLSPDEWAQMMEEEDPNTVVIDVRNDYEWEVGHFEGALLPKISTFREFPQYADELAKVRDPAKTRVMMYCTGGIRCELYSALMKEKGYSEVYQLDGGVIQYGIEKGSKHWRGKLFVFDDRLVVPISDDNKEVISCCHFCQKLTDRYFNCAHMDCNALFLSCSECVEVMKGCCSKECCMAPRVRPLLSTENPKPYRRLTKEEKEKLDG
jgi:UPF0176 protein